ncbi:MAG: hypothetical protein AAF196_06050 [Planctomycetota bacterium]
MNKAALLEAMDYQPEPSEWGYSVEELRRAFGGNASVIAEYREVDYSGVYAVAHKWPDGSVSILTDYFGSCCGCCAYQAASGSGDVRSLVEASVRNARVFTSEDEAKTFIRTGTDDAFEFSHRAAASLLTPDGRWSLGGES